MELAIITLKKEAGEIYSKQLRYFFGEKINIKLYSFEEGNINFIREKIIILSIYLKYEEILKKCSKDSQIIIPKLTFEKSSIESINYIKRDKSIFLYNLSEDMALETISLIHKLGVDELKILPIHPKSNLTPTNSIILTPGEKVNIQIENSQIIDLGYRVIDLSTIIDIAMKLNLDYLIKQDVIESFKEKVIPISYSTEQLLLNKNRMQNQFDLLLSVIEDGIICINIEGIVLFYSQIARKILDIDYCEMIGKFIGHYIKDIDFINFIKNKARSFEKILKINNVNINIDVKYIQVDIFDGFIIKLNKFDRVEKKQAKLRAQLMNSGNISKYTFSDIIGCSKNIISTKEIAYKMAQSDSSILITGESGTGKELFAQSIHSASNRNLGPFVAVNCGTFQENLLQSELFGYDEGAFTGAKKGGKMGLFELANKGTIFLDEIGEMDLNSQSKLLRVIQEKQVRRIGSDKVIDIDVRIIAATNRDLRDLVCKNKFRKDLYFRLNVLPLRVSSLRSRKEDIFLIFESFKKKIGGKFKLSEEVKKIFEVYNWEGNIRELRNLAEYCSYIGKTIIEVSDLPEYILGISELESYCNDDLINEKNEKNKEFKRNLKEYIFILDKLKKSFDSKERIGRRKLYQSAVEEDLFLTEQQIRSILLELQDFDLVKVLAGRGGTIITEKGIKFLERNN